MTGLIEVPETDGGLIVHAKPGGTLVLAFAADVSPERAREVVDQIAAGSPEARVIALADVTAVRSWHPSDAPAELRDAMAETRELREQLGDLQDCIGNLAAGLRLSAEASRPSKKSEIEDGCAAALYGLLRIDGESGEETRQRLDRQRAGLPS